MSICVVLYGCRDKRSCGLNAHKSWRRSFKKLSNLPKWCPDSWNCLRMIRSYFSKQVRTLYRFTLKNEFCLYNESIDRLQGALNWPSFGWVATTTYLEIWFYSATLFFPWTRSTHLTRPRTDWSKPSSSSLKDWPNSSWTTLSWPSIRPMSCSPVVRIPASPLPSLRLYLMKHLRCCWSIEIIRHSTPHRSTRTAGNVGNSQIRRGRSPGAQFGTVAHSSHALEGRRFRRRLAGHQVARFTVSRVPVEIVYIYVRRFPQFIKTRL